MSQELIQGDNRSDNLVNFHVKLSLLLTSCGQIFAYYFGKIGTKLEK